MSSQRIVARAKLPFLNTISVISTAKFYSSRYLIAEMQDQNTLIE